MIFDIITYTPMYVTVFWAILIFSTTKASQNRAKFLLGYFMVFAFLLYLSHAVYFQHSYTIFLYFDPIYSFTSLSVYPLYFWYIKLLTVEHQFKNRNLLMFLPAVLVSISTVIVYVVMGKRESENFILYFYYNKSVTIGETVDIQKVIFYIARFIFTIQIIYFLAKGIRLVKKYNKRIENFYSDTENKSIVWVKLLLISFVVTSLMSIVFNFLGKSSFIESAFILSIPSVIFSTLLFFIGFQGFLQTYTVNDLMIDETKTAPSQRTSYKQVARDNLKIQLLDLFNQEEIFTKNDLKITFVAEKLNTNRTYLSNLINDEFKYTFSDFVGRFRVKKAKQILGQDQQFSFSIDDVAEQVGFGSTNSFIRMFKKIEGITPGGYRSRELKNRDQNE